MTLDWLKTLLAVLGVGVLAGCEARSVVSVRNDAAAPIRAVVVMGAVDGAMGSRPDDRLYCVSLRPGESWSSESGDGHRSTMVVGRTIVYVRGEGGEPLIYSLPSPEQVSLRVVGEPFAVWEETIGKLSGVDGKDYVWLREKIEGDPVVRMRVGGR